MEIEAENIRSKVKSAGPLMRNLMEEINDTIQRLGKKCRQTITLLWCTLNKLFSFIEIVIY